MLKRNYMARFMEKAVSQHYSSDEYRYERKFVITAISLPDIISLVKQHPAGFRYHHPSRIINNIYFDDRNYNSVVDNIEGNTNRLKRRIRWYNDCFSNNIDSVLEYKIKNGHAGRKEYYPLEKFSLSYDFSGNYIRNIIKDSKLPGLINLNMSSLLPTLLNSYTRHYFVSNDNKFRLTLDNKINYYNLEERFNNFRMLSADTQSVIMELKYDIQSEEFAKEITNYFPFRVTKSSKYISGILYKLL